MIRAVTTSLLGLSIAGGMAGIGCTRSPQVRAASTEGQLVEQRAAVLRQKADLMQKGERLIIDGRGMIARGEAMRDQGNTLEGQNLAIEGEAKVRQGENYVAQANAVVLPSTQPTNVPLGNGYNRENETARTDLNK